MSLDRRYSRPNGLPDTLEHLTTLARSSSEPNQPYILSILHHLLSESQLHILPPSNLKPHSPTVLPHSYIVHNEEGAPPKQTGKGGKTRTGLDRAGRRKWQMLSTWVDEQASANTIHRGALPDQEYYDASKRAAVESIPEEVEISAERHALARLRLLATDQTSPSEGIERFEKMLETGARILRNEWKGTQS